MIRGVKRVCLGCGVLTDVGSRCSSCQATLDRAIEARRGPRPHYAGNYQTRAKYVRANAIVCWICGEGARVDDPWTADHVLPGDASPSTPLAAAHRSCNSRRGNGKTKRT